MPDHIPRHDGREQFSRSHSPVMDRHRSQRERSPHRHHHRRKKPATAAEAPKELPYGSRQLSKRDYLVFRPMFGLYLDIQKQKILDAMDEVEAKGRWKSFVHKWNRGELAEGWYDPSTLRKAITSAEEFDQISRDSHRGDRISPPRKQSRPEEGLSTSRVEFDSESDDSVGPELPGLERSSRKSRPGPSIPNTEDLELKREMEAEDGLVERDEIRFERKMDRKMQRDALNELVPRAEAGTRERQLEKKKEVNEKMKLFREKSPGAEEVPETDLMGGGDSISDFKKQKQEYERKKNDRELRKDEMLRARAVEREERMAEYKQKEDNTMSMLKALAKQNFG